MGIDIVTGRFLCFCRSLGVDFEHTATLGRQAIYLDRADFADFLRASDVKFSEDDLELAFNQSSVSQGRPGFADGIFKILGASTVDAIDASDYEGASIVFDLNHEAPDQYKSKYSILLDGGTLEHVFNFPIAVENCMKLLRTGGHFVSIAPANNFFGHGFYQFSSELFYRVFCEENGFRVKRVFLTAEKSFNKWYEIPDPKALSQRIALCNQVPTFQLFVAEKISHGAGLNIVPQQSDYSEILWKNDSSGNWTAHGDRRSLQKTKLRRVLIRYLPRRLKHFLRVSKPTVLGSIRAPFNNPSLKRFNP